ncbi:MAG: CoA-binding protein [Candidatus Marinimicrobia bacterium]|nr:CoA-binding protein [Candidatus Neomarinimicrobiota bacterium]|tara:strand:- start:56 stop:466 length:411 start_codon:yes stop_codon:yes gene_type:complete
MNDTNQILEILKLKNIAVIGASNKKERPSYFVSQYMLQHGYKIIPVNPLHKKINNTTCYPNLDTIKTTIETVNIFRKSEYVLPVVISAIKNGVKAIWMQDGVINYKAKKLAKNAGLLVVMDNCILRQHHLNIQNLK